MKWFDKETWQEVFETLKSNKKRTLITAFGIFWGIFMLVVLLSAAAGIENGVHREIKGVSTNSAVVITRPTTLPYHGFQKGRSWEVELQDLYALQRRFPEIELLSPLISDYGSYSSEGSKGNVWYGTKSINNDIFGCFPEYFEMVRQEVLAGRLLSPVDEREKRSVCLVSYKTATMLFGKVEDAIGKRIRANGDFFTVVGVVKPISKNISLGGSGESTLFIPFSLMTQKWGGSSKVGAFIFSVRPDCPVKSTLDGISLYLKERYDVSPKDTSALEEMDISSIFSLFSMLILAINLLGWIVGIGTLISGIVGVSNIMLVTVRERTQEIGVRRAIGASPKDIIQQILSESLIITSLSGIMGLLLGILLMSGADLAISSAGEQSDGLPITNPIISFYLALGVTGIIILSGLVAGIIPALRAIKIKAIDAIREE